MTLDLPVSADPVVWGVRSSLWHGDVPLRTPITHEVPGDDRVVFTWQTDRTALQERYRLEWRFRNDPGGVTARAPGHGQPA
ncbi:hypothetical protein AB0H83_12850 [Dactylosporangium sp. NPDC050688]|uniref:hypothetical protein n=1 Tax=Dactylosporangium sp. NPDC050688 TaxID=3157217 RepID=UPI0033FE8FD2